MWRSECARNWFCIVVLISGGGVSFFALGYLCFILPGGELGTRIGVCVAEAKGDVAAAFSGPIRNPQLRNALCDVFLSVTTSAWAGRGIGLDSWFFAGRLCFSRGELVSILDLIFGPYVLVDILGRFKLGLT